MQCRKCGFWLPEPTPASCPQCSHPFHSGDNRSGPPWESRSSGIDLEAMLATVKSVLFQPAETFRSMRREGGIGTPLLFVVILGTISGWFALLWNAFFQSLGFLSEGIGDQVLFWFLGLMIGAVLMPGFVLIGAFVSAAITHVSLFLVGGAKESFETTFRVTAYVSGSTSLFQIIPFCGGFIGGVWYLVAMIIGVREAHEISTGKAVLAILLPAILCCACLGVMIFFFGAAILTAIQNAIQEM